MSKVQGYLAVLATESPIKLREAVMALYNHFFVNEQAVTDLQDFLPVIERVIGHELAADVSARASTLGESLLTKNTDEAVDNGAFGLPWIIGEWLKSPPTWRRELTGFGSNECRWQGRSLFRSRSFGANHGSAGPGGTKGQSVESGLVTVAFVRHSKQAWS